MVEGEGAVGDEDTAIALDISALLTDTDGSEVLSAITIAGVPAGAALSAGTDNGGGNWSVDEADLAGLTITPPEDFSGNFELTVSATAIGTVNGEVSPLTTESFTVEVAPVADAPIISVPRGVGEMLAEQQVNQYNYSSQLHSDVATLADGSHVVVWMSYYQDGSSYTAMGRLFDADGNAVGNEFQINTTTYYDQSYPSVAANGDGGFSVSWSSTNQDGSGRGVYGQRFDANASSVGGEYRINTTTNSDQYLPSMADLADGGHVVTWNSSGQDGSGWGIYGQRYDADGNAVGGEFQINTTTSGSQYNGGHIANNTTGLADGGFVVTWDSADASGNGVFGQRFDADGNPVGAEFQVNTYTDSTQANSNAASLEDGGFIITWASNGQDGSGYGIYAQRFDAEGDAVGTEFQVNTATSSEQLHNGVTGLADGGFVVTWDSHGADGSYYGIVAQRFDADGNAVDGEVVINTTTAYDQRFPAVEARPDGGYVVTWSDSNADGSGWGIFQRVVEGKGAWGDEDSAIALDISALLSDTDGSEVLSAITIAGVPTGAVLSASTDNGGGNWTVDEADLAGLTITPPADFNGNFELTASATATETSNGDVSTATTESFVVEVAARGETFVDGAGNDAYVAEEGDDLFIFSDVGGDNTITDFTTGAGSEDVLNLSAFGLSDLSGLSSVTQVGADTLIQIDADDSVLLIGVNAGDLHDDDYLL